MAARPYHRMDSGSRLTSGGLDPQAMYPVTRARIRSRPQVLEVPVGEAAAEDCATDKFLFPLQVQFLLRFLDFLSINTVLPTLPDYMTRLGGHTQDYYHCLSAYALSFMLGTALLGAYMDSAPGRMLPSYIGTAVLIVAGSVLFSVAGSVPVLRRPGVLVLARSIVGLGASNAVLAMIYVTEVCVGQERQKWVIRFGITRSQGVFWGPALGVGLAALSSSDIGLWGADTILGWFQVLAVTAGVATLVATWQHINEGPLSPRRLRNGQHGECLHASCSFRGFLCQRKVLTVLLVMAVAATAQMACEVVIPVLCREALGWRGAVSGTPLTAMAVLLTTGQLSLMQLTKLGVEDRSILLLGAALYPAVLLGTVLMWLYSGPLDELKVLGPFMAVALVGPFANLGSMSVFTRLSMEQAPAHRGKIQAFQNNLLAMTNMAAPAWLSWSYSGERLARERVPLSCLAWLGLLELAALAALLLCYRELRPVEAQGPGTGPGVNGAAAPLLKAGV